MPSSTSPRRMRNLPIVSLVAPISCGDNFRTLAAPRVSGSARLQPSAQADRLADSLRQEREQAAMTGHDLAPAQLAARQGDLHGIGDRPPGPPRVRVRREEAHRAADGAILLVVVRVQL